MREQKNTFLLGVHLANEKDEGSYKNLKELFVTAQDLPWVNKVASENKGESNLLATINVQ